MKAKHFKGKAETKESAMQMIEEFLSQFDFAYPANIQISPVGPTMSYKAVFGIWCKSVAKSFTERDSTGKIHTKEDMHDLFCHLFLGYTKARKIGTKTTIQPALRTITFPKQLTQGEFYHFLQEIEIWASEKGVQLPQQDSDYLRDKMKQVA